MKVKKEDIQDISHYGIDAEEELLKILSEELAKSIDSEIIKSIRKPSKIDKIKNILEKIKKDNF
jgi:hypothetical protein